MKLKFTNGAGDESEINIKGKCTITDYDPRLKEPGKNDLTINVHGKSASIMNGTELQQDSQTVTMNSQKYSIFTAIAGMDGSNGDLTKEDIKKAKEAFKNEGLERENLLKLGITEIRYDSHASVATIVYGNNQILRIDFKAWRERLGIIDDSSTKVKNDEINHPEFKSYDSFFKDFAFSESSGDPKNMSISKEKNLGFAGLFQIGEQALADLGIYVKKSKNYNNDWTGKFIENKYGITSLSDFQNNPDKQYEIFVDILKKNWEHIENYHLDEYVGETINGNVLTVSGMLAGAHLVGTDSLNQYLNGTIEQEPTDGNGTKISKYISEFANYDMSSIIDIPQGAKITYKDISYTIKEGDNLSKIAKTYHTTVSRITKANGIGKDTTLYAGKTIIVPERIILL